MLSLPSLPPLLLWLALLALLLLPGWYEVWPLNLFHSLRVMPYSYMSHHCPLW